MFVVIRVLIIVITIGILEQMAVFWSRPVQAQPKPWIPVFEGLPPGPVPAMHMNVEGLLVAGTLGGIYRYEGEDGWVLTQVTDSPVETIASAAEGTLFAISSVDSTLFRSTDGVHWDAFRIDGLIAQTVVPVNDTLVYALIQDSRACAPEKTHLRWNRSQDGGASWVCVHNTSTFWRSIKDLHVTQLGTLLAATSENIYRSEDGGWQWTATTDDSGDSLGFVYAEFGGSSGPYVVVQDSPEEIYLSKDDGKSWSNTSLVGLVEDLFFSDQESLFIVLNGVHSLSDGVWSFFPGGIYRSIDDGLSWSLFALEEDDLTGITQKASDFFASSWSGMYRSTDQGVSWINEQRGLHNQWVIDIAVSPDQFVYMSTYPRRLHRSLDQGVTWEPVELPPFNEAILDYGNARRIATPRIWELEIAPDGTIYACDGNLLRSDDQGKTWDEMPVGFLLEDLKVNADGTLLAAGFASGVHRSTDRGASWFLAGDDPPDSYAVAAGLNGTLYAGELFQLSYLDPGASTWVTVDVAGYRIQDLAVDDEGRIYAGVWKHVDQDSLQNIAASMSSSVLKREGIDAVYLHPEASKRFPSYIGIDGGGVLRSEDRGRTWQHVGLDSVIVHALATDLDGRVYAGPYRSEDAGDTWTFIGEGISRTDIRTLSIDSSTGYVFAGTYGGGVYRSTFQALVLAPRSLPAASISFGPAYPNPYYQAPAGEILRIPLFLDRPGRLEVTVYDIQGREIRVLAEGRYPAGRHELLWESDDVHSGVYWVRLKSELAQRSIPVTIIR